MPLAILGLVLFVLGILISFIGGIWGIVLAFQDSATWGLLYLFVPFAALVFVVTRWSKQAVRRSFFLSLGGLAVGMASAILLGVFANSQVPDYSSFNESEMYGEPEITISSDDMMVEESSGSSWQAAEKSPEVAEPAVATEAQSAAPAQPTVSVAQTEAQPPCDFTQCMNVGYAAYKQGDYQTALINFERALIQRPDNTYALDAVENTKSAMRAN